jgi:hypothetical protein
MKAMALIDDAEGRIEQLSLALKAAKHVLAAMARTHPDDKAVKAALNTVILADAAYGVQFESPITETGRLNGALGL